jgi:hypothetical protein
MAFQYSLRRLFVWVSILALGLGIVGWRIQVAREYDLALALAGEQIRECGGSFSVGVAHENYYINLIDCNVTDERFRSMAKCFRKFSPRNIDGRGRFCMQLGNTALTDQSIPELVGLDFDTLNLSGTKITDASIPHLCKMNLGWLGLINTKISPQGVRRLKEAMPLCQIEYGIVVNNALVQPTE